MRRTDPVSFGRDQRWRAHDRAEIPPPADASAGRHHLHPRLGTRLRRRTILSRDSTVCDVKAMVWLRSLNPKAALLSVDDGEA